LTVSLRLDGYHYIINITIIIRKCTRKNKVNNGGEREAAHHRHHREEKATVVWPRQKDAKGENAKINYGMDTRREKKKRTSKKNADGRSTSSHDSETFSTKSMEKQGGMEFGFRKTVTAGIKPDRSSSLSATEFSLGGRSPYRKKRIHLNETIQKQHKQYNNPVISKPSYN
jgi:hypothetical protein